MTVMTKRTKPLVSTLLRVQLNTLVMTNRTNGGSIYI